MNISQMDYFVEIVEADFNLSIAAEKLHISQPALSNLITRFEQNQNVQLFVRRNGRNVALTPAGDLLYTTCKKMTKLYNEMEEKMFQISRYHKGVIRIGVPPLILSILFTQVLSQFIAKNPNIKFEIHEFGAYHLIDLLEAGKIDIAILLQPNRVNPKFYKDVLLYEAKLIAYMAQSHPLAQKTELTWQDLDDQVLATFDESFMIYHLLKNALKEKQVNAKIMTQSGSWDFLVETARQSEMLTLLPGVVQNFINREGLSILAIEDPIPWKISIVYPRKAHYSFLEQYAIDSLKKYFKDGEDILPIEEF
ncbi:LysR family transcriptional regulator [Streptococcus merionis]|uniref:LysR family transcriptional regulator n=1 Tax=Streptococcus merionis TaxID=400065 RepID=A0A239SSR2_9STRE|nr:LysR family transcriptional regulator [Streptococcus merionis]SNU87673.1 LysR family transcriptional regulator [Streptococcus merionis]